MILLQNLLIFAAALIMVLTLGPNMISRSICQGRWAQVTSLSGVVVGLRLEQRRAA